MRGRFGAKIICPLAQELPDIIARLAIKLGELGHPARPHGFRTSRRTWLAEATDTAHEVAEAMLAHVVDGSVVRAYRRTDYLEQRRALAERWADHVMGGAGAVVKLAAGLKMPNTADRQV